MLFPIIIPFAVATAKATTSYVAWFWGGAGVTSLGSLIYLLFKKSEPVIKPLCPSETPFHAIEEKIDSSLQDLTKTQLKLTEFHGQGKEELAKAKIAYHELLSLFKKLNRNLTDAKELEAIIEKISFIIKNNVKLIDLIQQNILEFKKNCSPAQQYLFFNSREFQKHQAEMQDVFKINVDKSLSNLIFFEKKNAK